MEEVLRVENIIKAFPGVLAVNDVSFTLNRGEVIALLGENGAGKSTLTKIICGALKPDSGEIYVNGGKVRFESANDAMKKGIGMVYQELSMVGNMTVAENIFMNRQPVNRLGSIRWNQLYQDTARLLAKFKIEINPKTLMKNLSVGTQQLIEILKAISMNPGIIILDEPTSSLTETETKLMFQTIRMLKTEGHSFIYISHKLSEIFQISDRVIVMRDGCYVGGRTTSDTDENEIIKMMVGREITDIYGHPQSKVNTADEYSFEVKDLSAGNLYHSISFGVRKGEILGVSGLIGAGRSELALGIIGAHKRDSGKIFLNTRELKINSPKDAKKNKISYLTEDRKKMGLYLGFSIKNNMAATQLERLSSGWRLNNSLLKAHAINESRKYAIATPSVEQLVGKLSGGNQQKCLLSMCLAAEPDVVIFDEPTRGVDVGAKSEIYKIIRNYAALGKCVILISSELPELLGVSDRILVLYHGRITGEVKKDAFDEELIMQYATNTKQAI
ncbi:MAG: sugar ABC transporter ATP-binding protein [Eubacteriales bacterium]